MKYSNEYELMFGVIGAFMGHRKIETYKSELDSICPNWNMDKLKELLAEQDIAMATKNGGKDMRIVFSAPGARGFAVYRQAEDFLPCAA